MAAGTMISEDKRRFPKGVGASAGNDSGSEFYNQNRVKAQGLECRNPCQCDDKQRCVARVGLYAFVRNKGIKSGH